MDGFITTTTAAKEIDMSTRHVQLLIKSGKIKAKRYGNTYLIPITEWLDYKARMLQDVKVG